MRQTIFAFFFILASCSTLPAQWQRVHLGLNYGPVYGCYSTSKALIAWTGDAIYESADGAQWTKTFVTDTYGLNWNVKGMNDNGLAVMSYIGDDSTVYISSDYGHTWNRELFGDHRLLTTVRAVCFLADTIFISTSSEGIWKSWDAGHHWTEVPTAPTFQHQSIDLIAATPERLYVARRALNATDTTQVGVSYTSDNGQSWILINDGLSDTVVTGLKAVGSDVYACTGLFVWERNSQNERWFPTGGQGIFQRGERSFFGASGTTLFSASTDGIAFAKFGNLTWQQVDLPDIHSQWSSIQSLNVYADNLVVATDRGLFISTDKGKRWTLQQMYDKQPPMLGARAVQGSLFLGSWQSGLYQYDIHSGTCASIDTISVDADNFHLTYYDTQIAAVDSTIFAMPSNGSIPIYRHSANSTTWDKLPNSAICTTGSSIYAFHKKVFVVSMTWQASGSTFKTYASTDGGMVWQIDNQIAALDPDYNRKSFYVSSDTLFLTIDNKGVYFSTDGDHWASYLTYTQSPISGFYSGVGTQFLSSYVAYHVGSVYNSYDFTLRSVDHGITWDTTFRQVIGSMMFDHNAILTTVNGSGVMASYDGGTTWIPRNDGIDISDVTGTMKFCRSGDSLYLIGLYGVYMIPSISLVSSVSDQAIANEVYNVHPNPVNSIAQIECTWTQASVSSDQHCSVLDLCARPLEEKANICVSSVDEMHSSIAWDCSQVPDGVYVVQVRRGVERRDIRVVVCH